MTIDPFCIKIIKDLRSRIKRSDSSVCRAIFFIYKLSWVVRNLIRTPYDFFFYMVFPASSFVYYLRVKKRLRNLRCSNKKTVLFINNEETGTGAPKVLFEIARSLKQEFDVVIFSLRRGELHKKFNEAFDLIIYPDRIFIVPSTISNAKKLISEINPDIVYINTMVCQRYARASKELEIATICHVHELSDSLQFCFLNKMELQQYIESGDFFIASSRRVHRFLLDELGINAAHAGVIPSFVSSDEILRKSEEISRDEVISQTGKKPHEILVVASGRIDNEILVKRKGLDILLETHRMMPGIRHCSIRFVWLGKYRSSIVRRIRRKFSSGDDKFVFMGEKENPFPYIRAADIFVLPSRSDPFPLVVLEGMVLGKPVLAFRGGGGACEAVGDECGIIIDRIGPEYMKDAVLKLINDRELMNKLSQRGPEKQRKFDKNAILPVFKMLIRKKIML